ncbi:recombinase family protein [Methylobacterium aerolatum]|uniref:DNA invertase Pin-like site-specific DNA recombinase n=1 Tax=Methylobacterium aerolatum TaxID=418708 RepID=A0ABU0HUG8_9HYPH|nr:recombinase family protein [Methylobacterium aerolatum]MDQ0445968.1 DNA invertase Pin-like site-specific DNA recombinase [Methylobacterium aerolatum]
MTTKHQSSTPHIIGYARVSTEEQRLDLQVGALERAGCERIYTDHGVSGFRFSRGGLKTAMKNLRPGGTLVVWRLDRLGRSLSGLVLLMEQLGSRGIHFRSVTENIDTSSSGGRLMFHMMAALAEFERSLISERTRAGMAAAKARGCRVGRPRALVHQQIVAARCALLCHGMAAGALARDLGVSPRTLQRSIAALDGGMCRDCPGAGVDGLGDGRRQTSLSGETGGP